MPWETPKTNWKSSDAVSSQDLNRIEGNLQIIHDTMETEEGAQEKADEAEANAKEYTDQKVADKVTKGCTWGDLKGEVQ